MPFSGKPCVILVIIYISHKFILNGYCSVLTADFIFPLVLIVQEKISLNKEFKVMDKSVTIVFILYNVVYPVQIQLLFFLILPQMQKYACFKKLSYVMIYTQAVVTYMYMHIWSFNLNCIYDSFYALTIVSH